MGIKTSTTWQNSFSELRNRCSTAELHWRPIDLQKLLALEIVWQANFQPPKADDAWIFGLNFPPTPKLPLLRRAQGRGEEAIRETRRQTD